jgi:UPF0716 protein FxsA
MRALFLLFLVLPIVELLLLIEVGSRIGGLATVALVLVSMASGVGILRWQRFSRLTGRRREPSPGQLPGQGLFGGMLIFLAGVLLIVPGFITDSLGLLLLLPFVRTALVKRLLAGGPLAEWTRNSGTFTFTRFGGIWPPPPEGSDVYEGDFIREEPPEKPRDPTLRGPDQD